MSRIIRSTLGRLWGDAGGGLLTYTAFLAPVVFGFAGLSVDVGYWYATARATQNAADSAAVAGALEIVRSGASPSQIAAAVSADAANHGFSAASGDTITVNYPPASGPSAGSADAIEVVVSRPAQNFFSAALLGNGNPNVAARAVARADVNDTCVWALNPTDSSSVSATGHADVELGCGIFVNSASATALVQSGAGCLEASEIRVVGGYSVSCATPTPGESPAQVADPLAALAAPSYGGCDHTGNTNVSGSQSLAPGVYCGNIRINANADVVFQPGVYVLDGAGLDISGQATVSGTDVTFYLTENSGMSENITISGGADVSLSAPALGALAGILFYQDRSAPSNVTHRFTGGSDMDLNGILYFPNQDVQFAGGSELEAAGAYIVADTVTFTGDTEIELETVSTLSNPLFTRGVLVE